MVELDAPLAHEHWGGAEYRAEVGLLSRRLVVEAHAPAHQGGERGIVLHGGEGESSKQTSRDRADPRISPMASFAESAVDHRHRNTTLRRFPQETRPHLEFDEPDRIGLNTVEDTKTIVSNGKIQ